MRDKRDIVSPNFLAQKPVPGVSVVALRGQLGDSFSDHNRRNRNRHAVAPVIVAPSNADHGKLLFHVCNIYAQAIFGALGSGLADKRIPSAQAMTAADNASIRLVLLLRDSFTLPASS